MRHPRIDTVFYSKKWEGPKDPIILYLKCKECEKTNIIPDLQHDFKCDCGNIIVEHIKSLSKGGGALNSKYNNDKIKKDSSQKTQNNVRDQVVRREPSGKICEVVSRHKKSLIIKVVKK